MRKILFICSLFALFAITTYAQTSVTIGSVTATSVGSTISIPVDVANFNNMQAVTLAIQYNAGAVRFDSVSRSSEFFAGANNGQITITRASLSAVTPQNGRLLNLYFTYLGGSTELSFNQALCELVNTSGTVTGVIYNNGNIFASTSLSVKVDSVESVAVNSTLTVPVTVASFNNIGAVTLKIQYDPSVVQFDSVSRSGEFFAGASAGVITITRASLSAVTPVNGKLLDIYFKYLGGNSSFSFDQAGSQITNLTTGPVAVNYINGGVFDPNATVYVSLDDVVATTAGSTVSVPLSVDNFSNIGAVTFKILYNPANVQFDSTSRNNEFFSGAASGVITITRASLSAIIPDSGKVLDLYFKYLGGSTNLEFDEAGSEITNLTTGPVSNVVYTDGRIAGDPSSQVTVSLATVVADAGQSEVAVPVSVDNFTNVGAITLKIQYDPAVAQFDSVSRSGEFFAGANGGILTITRASLTAVAPDSGKLFDIYFKYLGGNTNLAIDETNSEIANISTGKITNVIYNDGGIVANSASIVKVELGSVNASTLNSTIAVPLTVDNFTNIGAVTLKVQYDPAVARFDSTSRGSEFFSGASSGVLTITRAQLTAVTPDSGKVLDVYFTYLGGSTPLTFDQAGSEIANLTTGKVNLVNYVNGAINSGSGVIVKLDTVYGAANQTVEVPLTVTNLDNVGAVTLKVLFDPAIATFDSVSRSGEFFAGVSGNVLTIARASLTAVTPTDGKLLSLYFTYKGGSTALSFDAAGSQIADLTTGPISGITYVNGYIAQLSTPVFNTTMPNVWINEGDTLRFTYVATDPNGDALTYALVAPAPSGASINATSGVFTWVPTFEQAGTYNVIVSVSDGSNTVVDTAVVTVLNTNRNPVFVNVLGANEMVPYQNPGSMTFQYTATDPDNDPVFYSLIGSEPNATITAGGLFKYTANDSVTFSDTVKVKVSDAFGGADTSITVFSTDVAVIPGTEIPTQFALAQNYPNPFNPSTAIRFDLPKESYVTLKVYNLLGEQVSSIVNEYLPAGQHIYKFEASNLSTGIYIYRIQAGDFISTKKMTLIK